MIKVQTERGEISISNAVFTTITGAAATNCFGVKGMAYRSMKDGLVHLLRPESMSKGVMVTYNDDGTVTIELHIIVENGVADADLALIRKDFNHKQTSFLGRIPVCAIIIAYISTSL